MRARSDFQSLLNFNQAVLEQGLQVIIICGANPQIDFSKFAGPHLRHIIEHYEAFTQHIASRSVDYDSRQRDKMVETQPEIAAERLRQLQRQLGDLRDNSVPDSIAVHLRGGLAGEENFVTFSTVPRELMFLASHAIHHYAQIKLYLAEQQVSMSADFGKAPSTVHAEHWSW